VGEWVHTISGDDSGGLWASLNDRVMHGTDGRFSALPPNGLLAHARRHCRVVQRMNRGGFWTVTPAGLTVFVAGRTETWTRMMVYLARRFRRSARMNMERLGLPQRENSSRSKMQS